MGDVEKAAPAQEHEVVILQNIIIANWAILNGLMGIEALLDWPSYLPKAEIILN